MVDIRVNHYRRYRLKAPGGGLAVIGALALATGALGSACLPSNNIGSARTATKTVRAPAKAANTDGAQGFCRNLDSSNPDRLTCKTCYQTLLAQKCGTITAATCTTYATDPAACCADAAVRASFPTMVNSCVAQTNLYGTVCSTSCPTGQVLSTSSCTCIPISSAPAPTMPAGGSTYINVGETNWGPPVVSAQFDPAYLSTSIVQTMTACSARIDPIPMFVTNRAGTVPSLNVAEVPAVSCKLSDGTAATSTRFGGPSVSQVKIPAPGGNTSSGFNVTVDGLIDQFGMYWENFDAGIGPGWKLYNAVDPQPITYAIGGNVPYFAIYGNRLLGRFYDTHNPAMSAYPGYAGPNGARAAELTLPRMPVGPYELDLDVYLIDGWMAVAGNNFQIRYNGTTILQCSPGGITVSTSNSYNGRSYGRLNCTNFAGATHTLRAFNSMADYAGNPAGLDLAVHIHITGISVATAGADTVIRFQNNFVASPAQGELQSTAIDNVMFRHRGNLVYENDFDGNSVNTVQGKWMANGLPVENIPGIGPVAGRFGRTEEALTGVAPPTTGFLNSACATLNYPYLAAGNYYVGLDFFAFDTWDGTGHTSTFTPHSVASRDEFFIKIQGDSDFTFRHYFSNNSTVPVVQSYGGPNSCYRIGPAGDDDRTYCKDCARPACDIYTLPTHGKPAAGAAVKYENIAHSGDKDSLYFLKIPFTQPSSGPLIMHFCGNLGEDDGDDLNLNNESFGIKNVYMTSRGNLSEELVYVSDFGTSTAFWSLSNLTRNGTTTTGDVNSGPTYCSATDISSAASLPLDFTGVACIFGGGCVGGTPYRCQNSYKQISISAATNVNSYYITPPFRVTDVAPISAAMPPNYSPTIAHVNAPAENFPTPTETVAPVLLNNRYLEGLSTVLGPFSQATKVLYPSLYMRELPEGDYMLEADIIWADSWDGPSEGEALSILVNGTRVVYATEFVSPTGAGGPNMAGPVIFRSNFSLFGATAFIERVFRLRLSFTQKGPSKIGDPPLPAVIEFIDKGSQGVADESFAIDNVSLRKTLTGVPELRCGIRYRFTDSNSNAADYCLRFKPKATCSYGQCACTAQPITDLSGAFVLMSSSSNQCP